MATNIQKKHQIYIIDQQPIPDSDPDVPQHILDSWKRSRKRNLPWQNLLDFHLSDEELDTLLRKNQTLLRTGHAYMVNLYQNLKNSGILLSLADRQGTIIDFIGDHTTLSDITEQTNLYLGAMRDEPHAGTTAIGLCITTRLPIQIQGAEHYCQTFHHHIGTAAPICDRNNRLIGILGSVAPLEQASQNYLLAMIRSAADSISKEMAMEETLLHIRKVKNQLSTTIEAIPNGILFVDPDGRILQYNQIASQLLGIYQSLENQNIDLFLSPKATGHKITSLQKNIHNIEYTVSNGRSRRKSLSISVSFVYDMQNEAIGKVIILEEINKVHQLAGKISGFHATYTFDSIIGSSQKLSEAKEIARSAANSSSNVLILGESGTGKELFAQAIHNASNRADRPFVAINCGSLPKDLIESELFGYVPGAFTGASKNGQPGKFELANGGTIFLDEIGDMPLTLQVSLLRVLQSKTITRLGDTHEKPIDVRVITATNVNLLEAVRNQTFRSDLYYRLNVLPIEIPPLRERQTDIPHLVYHFIADKSRKLKKEVNDVTDSAMHALCHYSWPGNIRELENIIERAVNLAEHHSIRPENLPAALFSEKAQTAPAAPNISPSSVYQIEKETVSQHADFEPAMPNPKIHYPQQSNRDRFVQELIDALHAEKGNITQTAKRMQISKRTLYRRLEKYQIDPDKFRY